MGRCGEQELATPITLAFIPARRDAWNPLRSHKQYGIITESLRINSVMTP